MRFLGLNYFLQAPYWSTQARDPGPTGIQWSGHCRSKRVVGGQVAFGGPEGGGGGALELTGCLSVSWHHRRNSSASSRRISNAMSTQARCARARRPPSGGAGAPTGRAACRGRSREGPSEKSGMESRKVVDTDCPPDARLDHGEGHSWVSVRMSGPEVYAPLRGRPAGAHRRWGAGGRREGCTSQAAPTAKVLYKRLTYSISTDRVSPCMKGARYGSRPATT
jgi:hypothetical protein